MSRDRCVRRFSGCNSTAHIVGNLCCRMVGNIIMQRGGPNQSCSLSTRCGTIP
eukprot:XP_001705790.1 Hypothetical protein GL50803_113273 [Giardia lamblia ATCC 50803]